MPSNHPLRFVLNNEIHARPHIPVSAPHRISYLALTYPDGAQGREYSDLKALCQACGVVAPHEDVQHFLAEMAAFRLKWERHAEFVSYTFFRPGEFDEPFSQPAIGVVPEAWLGAMSAEVVVAAHASIRKWAGEPPHIEEVAPLFDFNYVVGARISDACALAFTDFRIHGDGFSRFLVLDLGMTERQAGRALQRLFEIETYRMMALLAYPVARAAWAELKTSEDELAVLTAAMATAGSEDEPRLLDALTRLAATAESSLAQGRFRFSAARAYYELTQARVAELRETRLPGVQTVQGFLDRRLAPAMRFCEAARSRQEDLTERVARASSLLRTRVDVARERQNQALLASMDRRAQLQLRLQETVEGLSVAAITYYAAGLVGYLAKAAKSSGLTVDPDLVVGLSIPIIALLVAFGVRHIRRSVARAVGKTRSLEL
jgi:uncharacterized membrane-anchored protein